MAFIIEVPNPFEPLTNIKKHIHVGGISIWEWLREVHPGFKEFDIPTICLVNGKALLRKDWGQIIQDRDVVNFVGVPQGPIAILIAVIVVAAILLAIFFGPIIPGEAPASDPVFSTKGQTNSIRLGEPIEVNYGRNRIYPSLAARPYFQYFNNDQFQFSLFCLGQGEYTISAIQIGDTAIASYQEVDYEVVTPGNNVTLFPANVYTAVEVGGLVLYSSNEDEYPADGWVGPFFANASATDTYQIQVDLILPKGLYAVNSKGNLSSKSITVEFQKREVDDAGAPLGAWSALLSPSPTTVSYATTTPQRKTYSATVTAGRYEVRARRTDIKDKSHRAGHEVTWDGLRAYLDVDQDWGDVTLLAVKIRATANLNERTAQRFNVIATRQLLTWTGSAGWSALTATRSIAWALVDVFKATYGARLTDTYLDLDALETLDALYTSRGDYFDWSFRDSITVWEAARTIARVGRAVPLLAGSLVTMKRDGPLTVPVALFGQDNIISGSFQWNVKLWELDEHDGLQVEYTDADTGYKAEQVSCTLPPGGTPDDPRQIRLFGCQDRVQAYREGLYMLASERYLRETIVFDTGMEGHIPTFGDLIAISHDVPRWGQAGYVVHAVDVGGYIQLWVSEPLRWDESGPYVIMLRDEKGDVLGPYEARQTDDDQQVVITTTDTIDFLLGGKNEPMLFLFGLSEQITKYAKVVRVEPQGKETVRITSVNNAPEIHTYDIYVPSSLPIPTWPDVVPDLPTITSLNLSQVDGISQKVQASWTKAYGAQSYILQISYDGNSWTTVDDNIKTTSIVLDVRPGDLWVRVAGKNEGQGPWIEETMTVVALNMVVTIPWLDTEWQVEWWEVPNAVSYLIKVYDDTESEPILKRTVIIASPYERDYLYDYTMAVADGNLNRSMLVRLWASYPEEGVVDPYVEEELVNDVPSPPTNLDYEFQSEHLPDEYIYRLLWTVPAEDDLIRLRLWISPTPGFDPDVLAPFIDFTAAAPGAAGLPVQTTVTIPLESDGGHPAWYWRVAVIDVWGPEEGITDEQTIPAVP